MSSMIPDANGLVSYIKSFTGSTNDTEIKQCIFLAEMQMRNIELPALRCDPYAPENIGVADSHGRIPIPGDMNKPILFFKQGQQYITTATATGNIGENTVTVTADHVRSGSYTNIITDGIIPTNDAINLLSGKMVLQTSDSINIKGSANAAAQIILSILETANP